jgi:polysaccharide biosynthesis protein PslH
VTLAAIADESVTDEQFQHMASICKHVEYAKISKTTRWLFALRSLALRKSLTEGLFYSSKLHHKTLQLHTSNPFDACLVFCSSMYPYVAKPQFDQCRKIVDLVDVDSLKWEQIAKESRFPKNIIYAIEAKRVRALETSVAKNSHAVVLVSESEAQLFRNRMPDRCPVYGVSNGVDTDYFHPPADWKSRPKQPEFANGKRKIKLVFTGVMNYKPNVQGMLWFCNEVMPELQKELHVELVIVGKNPCREIYDLNSRSGIQVTGEVADVRPFLHAADIAVSPLHLARGIQNKVLEAMACGLPLVVSPQSAEGICGIDGVHLRIAVSKEQWCAAIKSVLTDGRETGERARQLVLDHYVWSARVKSFTSLFQTES